MSAPQRASQRSLVAGFTFPDPGPGIQAYVDRVRRTVADGRGLRERVADVAAAAGGLCQEGCDLPASCLQVGRGPYGRNLVYRDPDFGFVVIAMVWPARTDAPPHDHGTWCAVGVVQGRVRITSYERSGDGPCDLEETGTIDAGSGDSCLILPPREDIHRVWNPFEAEAVTLHTYGKDTEVCSAFDLERRTATPYSLDYVNLVG